MNEERLPTRWERQVAAQVRAEDARRAVLAEQAGAWRPVVELRLLLRARAPVREGTVRQLLETLVA